MDEKDILIKIKQKNWIHCTSPSTSSTKIIWSNFDIGETSLTQKYKRANAGRWYIIGNILLGVGQFIFPCAAVTTHLFTFFGIHLYIPQLIFNSNVARSYLIFWFTCTWKLLHVSNWWKKQFYCPLFDVAWYTAVNAEWIYMSKKESNCIIF